jgi:hypothetical protein
MFRVRSLLLLILPVLLTPLAQAQEDVRKPQIFKENLVTVKATVSAIDHDTRMLTLTGEDGEEVDFLADEEIRNLDQVEVGDTVTAQFYQSMAVEVREAEGSMRVEGTAGGSRAEPGEKPAGSFMGEVTVVAEVQSIDRDNATVVLKGLGESGIGLETVRVADPANLENVEVGDQVVITYLEALAISVEEGS